MANYLTTDTELSSVANAIRGKTGGSEDLVFPSGFVAAIEQIPTGGGGVNGLNAKLDSKVYYDLEAI